MNAANNKLTTAAGSTTAALQNSIPSAAEKNKQWQRELLMERLRSHASQQRTFPELSKAMRMSMLEKRYALDAVEKSNLQKCLDSMQHCIKVTSRQGLVERLESLSRQLGLKFMEDTSGLFISTDMFFLEIMLDANGALTDVKVHHECKIEQQSCSELVNCLNRGDFADFTVQLEGLSSIYQLNAEPKVKTKAFVALQAMETDLYNLFQMQNFSKDAQQLIKESAVGIVLKRRGGHPMKLTYFISPYDLISLETKSLQPLSIDLITEKQIGLSVTVNLEASSANKLQILPTVTFSKDSQTSIDMPVYAPLTQANSMLLPATFVLRLNKPLPVCYATLRALGINLAGAAEVGPSGGIMESQHKAPPAISTIMNLIVQTASEQQLKSSQKALFVALPDQTHCYFFTENKQLKATLVSSVPFTEPSQVPKILNFLKNQALFYTLVSSCVRSQTKMGNDMETTTILEVNAISFQQISVALQHPYEESMATVEFDLRDGNVHCTIFSLSRNYDLLSLKLTKIVQISFSIPVTIRALLKFWDQESMKVFQRSIGGSSSAVTGSSGGGVGMNQQGSSSGGSVSGNTASGNGGFGNFSLAMGPNDSGGGRNIGSSGVGNDSGCMTMETNSMRMESNAHQQQEMEQQNTTAATAVAGFLKFKNELQNEDYHDGATLQQANGSMMQQSLDMGTLGHSQQQQPQQQQQQQLDALATPAKASDIEIADKYKNIWKDKTPNLKNCVSITPISAEAKTAAQQSVDVKRTGGIEIIPLTAQATAAAVAAGSGIQPATVGAATLPITTATAPSTSSAITITPINSSASSSGNLAKEKKSSSSGSGSSSTSSNSSSSSSSSSTSSSSSGKRSLDSTIDAAQKEKKRKKKRDDSPMGPPEKVYSRQNSPAANSDAAATVAARKFSSPSSSPKGGSGGSILAAGGVAASASLSTRPSPKHSPVYSSPKHNTASNSPKSPFGTHSPKHGSSGKPSMSTLKSAAATSLSPKGDKASASSAASLGMGGGVGVERSSSVPNVNATPSALLRTFLNNSAAAAAAGAGIGGAGGSANAATSGSNIPAAVATASKQRDKEQKLSLSSPTASAAGSSVAGSAAAAAAATSAGMKLAAMQQQLRTVAGLSHLATAGNLGSYGGAAVAAAAAAGVASAMDSIRKGAAGAVSLMTSTATTMAPTATTAHQQQLLQQQHRQQPEPLGSNESYASSSETSSEYIIKSSQEGLKLTINKTSSRRPLSSLATATASTTKTKSIASSLSRAPSSTPLNKKQRTGLKPGVNAGPASKKPNLSLSTSSSASLSSSSPASSSKKSRVSVSPLAEISILLTSPSSSSSSLSSPASSTSLQTKSSSSASVGTLSPAKSASISNTKHIFKKSASAGNLTATSTTTSAAEIGAMRKATGGGNLHSKKSTATMAANNTPLPSLVAPLRTQPYTRLDSQMESLKLLQYTSPAMAATMEGYLKSQSNKFQIPKLSQRVSATVTATTTSTTEPSITATTVDTATTQQHAATSRTTITPFLNDISAFSAAAASSTENLLCRLPSDNDAPQISTASRFQQSQRLQEQQRLQQEHEQHYFNMQQLFHNSALPRTIEQRQRSPPPSYNASIAAANAAVIEPDNNSGGSSTQSMQSAVTLRIDATVNRHRHQHEHELQQQHAIDDFLVLNTHDIPSTSTSDSVSASIAAIPMSAITSMNEQFTAEVFGK